jgi:hypothetical protein
VHVVHDESFGESAKDPGVILFAISVSSTLVGVETFRRQGFSSRPALQMAAAVRT